jgi:hypothetical protein
VSENRRATLPALRQEQSIELYRQPSSHRSITPETEASPVMATAGGGMKADAAAPDPLGAVLSDHHRQMLEVESAIAPAIIRARGYRTVTDREELLQLGFEPYQAITPGLLIPLYGPYGSVISYQYRPDSPRKDAKGKDVKYETRKGYRQVLDANPILGDRLRDPRDPLIVTEGARKADAATSQGYVAVALSGVWCWRKDGVQLPEWEEIKLYGREVIVAFDSDVQTNVHVRRALEELCKFLYERGANA